MDLKQLRYFAAVYERRNLSHAAQQCCVAQSAISHHLSNLEAKLGAKLFERLARGMEPTPAGTRLYEHAQAILRSLAAAAEDVHQMAEEISGEMQLGLPHTVIDAIAVPFLKRLRQDLPHAKVVVHEAFSSELYRELLSSEHDLIFCYNVPADDRVKLTRLHDEQLCCVGTPELLGNTDAEINAEEVISYPQFVLRRHLSGRSISSQQRFLDSLYSRAAFEMNSVDGMRKAVAAGLAVVVLPYITVRDLVRAGSVVARPIANPVVTRTLFATRLSERLPTRLMNAVQDMVTELIREQTDDGSWPVAP